MAYCFSVLLAYLHILLVLLSVLCTSRAQENSIGNCSFNRDCESYNYCQTIQDASCVCNFGKCVITGNPFFRGNECDQYTDCACKDTRDSCFCRDGFCREVRWECHEVGDCTKLRKCKGLNCACSGNLCEYDCGVDEDCKDHHCNTALGYTCKCENSLCAYKQKQTECKTIADCVQKGLCKAGTACACTQEYCTLPWWVQGREEYQQCRSHQDCEDIILDCQGGKCSCVEMAPVSQWESRGRCEKKNQKSKVKTEASEEELPKYEKNKVKPVSGAIVFPTDEQSDSEEDKRFSVKNLGY